MIRNPVLMSFLRMKLRANPPQRWTRWELPDRAPAGDNDTLRAFEFAVGPDTTNAPPDALIEREQIPQKWLRVDVDLGALKIDLSQGAEAVDRAVTDFNVEMQRRIEQAIDAWLADSDPNSGGLLWAFPSGQGVQSQTITPAELWLGIRRW